MFRHRLFGIEFKATNHLNKQTGTQVSAQAGIEDFSGIFQERLRGTVGDGLLAMFDEVLWKKHDSNWNAEDFRRYAFRCADIEARSYHRKCRRLSKRIVFLAPDVVQALGNETQEQIDADPVPVRGRIEALRQCLDGLDPVQRQLLDARYEKDGVGKSVADIAREKGCKMETLYKRLERIRTSLHNCISKRLKDLPA